jgi:hypothetical protein
MTQEIYFVEVTDTYGEEANYSWVRRYKVHASSMLGAIRKVSKESGFRFRKDFGAGDFARYKARGACVCAFIEGYENQADIMREVVSI